MTRHLVDVTEYRHTCPGDPAPHVIASARTLIETTPGGPCHSPRTVRSGTTTVTVDCVRLVPPHQQCPACRNTVTIRATTVVDLGPEHPVSHPAPSGNAGHAAQPCTVCGKPLAAVLTSWGRHLLCVPTWHGAP